MFCYKCGSELPDEVRFCHKCGAKLIGEDTQRQAAVSTFSESIQQMQQPQVVTANMPKKKKSGKLLIGLGVAVIVVIVVIIIALNWNGKTDYAATVGAHTPFATTQGLPYTYEEVLNKYISSPKWEVRDSGDVHYVDISGTLKGMDNKLSITIQVALDSDDSDIVIMRPESVTLDGIQTSNEDEATRFLYNMFLAYDEGYSDLSWIQTELNEEDEETEAANIDDVIYAEYEEIARKIIIEWFSRHPLQHNFRIEFMNETANTEDGSGIYLRYEMYWGDDEWYGSFYVNPASGDMNMDSMIKATGITTVHESMDQWYLEDYWFLGEDLGGYSEFYEDNIYFLYNGYSEDENPILEYYADNDSYRICDYDGQCLIEYDDGSETSEISIMDFAGIYAYDGSFEADDREINFYYLLEIGEWDGYSFSIAEIWRGNMLIQDEYARAKSLIVDTLTFDIYNPDAGYETHSLTYVPANESTLGKDVIYLDGDNTMPFVKE